MTTTRAMLAAVLLGLCSCAPAPSEPAAAVRNAPLPATSLLDPSGKVLARVSFVADKGDVIVAITAAGLAPGTYAAHVHTTGRCDAPDFASAGGHWNPRARQHGLASPQGAHLGDLPNLAVAADGRGSVVYLIAGATLTIGANALRDADGAAVIVHANADDGRTDPSGNSGGRIACGVVAAAR